MTVALSVLAHGASAAPLATRYANWLDARSARSSAAPSRTTLPTFVGASSTNRKRREARVPEEARRIAVRAQLLDGSATTILDTVRTLGFLQIDPISTVAPPQQLVLWSRLGPYDIAELDRLLWDERTLFEWNAYIWPIEALPLVRARMRRRRRSRHYAHEQWSHEFLQRNARFKRYVLRELDRNGPMPSRELQARGAPRPDEPHRWWGSREVTLMLEILHAYGVVAVAGRQGKQRLWDLADRWYPPSETMSAREADRSLAEQRFRALGVRLTKRAGRHTPTYRTSRFPSA